MLTIALCDDDRKFMMSFENVLKQQFSKYDSELNFTLFTSGKSLLTAVQSNPNAFQIIFLDVEMPEMDGFAVAQALHGMKSKSILSFVTNNDNEVDEGYYYKAACYLIKGNYQFKLERGIRAIMERFNEESSLQTPLSLKIQKTNSEYSDTLFYVGNILYLES